MFYGLLVTLVDCLEIHDSLIFRYNTDDRDVEHWTVRDDSVPFLF